jgi:CheY-like chemotaxis protein
MDHDRMTAAQIPTLGDELAVLAQEQASMARSLGIWFSFDYSGPALSLVDGARGLASLARLMLERAVNETEPQAGCVFFNTHVWHAALCDYRVRITVAHTSQAGARDDEIEQRASAARRTDHRGSAAVPAALRPHVASAGAFWLTSVSGNGRVMEYETTLASGETTAFGSTDRLSLPQAWLIGPVPQIYDRLAVRLQRDGWLIRQFDDIAEASQLLAGGPHAPEPPAMAFATEHTQVSLDDFRRWAGTLPGDSRCIWATSDPTSVQTASPTPDGTVEVRRFPLSPADLRELREVAHRWEQQHFAASIPAPLDGHGRPQLLVVDDNLVNRILATEMLRALGYDADAAEDGREALEYCQRYRPGAVLMDLHMPVMDGVEATRRLRQLEFDAGFDRTPLIFVTTATGTEEQALRTNPEVDAVLGKPLILEELRTVLRAAMPS